MRYFFTSDTHFGHGNIIKYCGRTLFMTKEDLHIYNELKNKSQKEQKKFKLSDESLSRMDRTMIKRFNERVKENDIVFFLGDFCFKLSSEAKNSKKNAFDYYRNQLNCKNIIFIKGNHDKNNSTKTIIEKLVINHGGKRISLVHNPEFVNINYELNFCGHVHEKWKFKRIKRGFSFTDVINIGVDCWNFYPITFDEIAKEYSKWKKLSPKN